MLTKVERDQRGIGDDLFDTPSANQPGELFIDKQEKTKLVSVTDTLISA